MKPFVLQYFCEDMPEMAVAAAGSLLGLHLGNSAFPVGKVDMLTLNPMSFDEFLLALGDERLLEALEKPFGAGITPFLHELLWMRLKWYFVTGGLPEVVVTFRDHQDDLYAAFSATIA